MVSEPNLSPPVIAALAAAARKPGWNNRAPTVHRFALGGCTLFVVPFRCWAYRRRDQQTTGVWCHAL